MLGLDVKAFALLAVATTAIIGALKKSFPAWVDKKEPLLAVVVPVLFTVIAKLTGLFKETEWVDALLWAFGAGVGSGLFHDKFVEPLMQNKSETKK